MNDTPSKSTSPISPNRIDMFPIPSQATPKRVEFFPTVQLREYYVTRYNMTPEEHQKCWYNEDEYEAIRDKIEETVLRSQAYDTFDSATSVEESEDFCMRGLEHVFGRPLRKRASLRRRSIYKVLEEQDKDSDDETIAEVYFKATRKCRFRAQVRALRDHCEVVDYVVQTESDLEDYLLQGLDGITKGMVRERATGIRAQKCIAA